MKPLETLRALGTGGEAPAEAKERVYSTLMASLSLAAATTAPVVAPSPALISVPAPLLAGLSNAKALAAAAGIWLIGGATGAALYSALHPREVQLVYVDRPMLSASVVAPPVELLPSVSASGAASVAAAAAAASGTKQIVVSAVSTASQLSRERALLDLARASAARGEPSLSLQRTEQHRTQFPHGKLAEEREALAIRALQSLGRSDEARARAQAFRLTYPNSFLTPALDSALSAP